VFQKLNAVINTARKDTADKTQKESASDSLYLFILV